jgi:hypothetical protein
MMTQSFGGEEKMSKKTEGYGKDGNAYDHDHPVHPSETRLMTESAAWYSKTARLHGLGQLIRKFEGLNQKRSCKGGQMDEKAQTAFEGDSPRTLGIANIS